MEYNLHVFPCFSLLAFRKCMNTFEKSLTLLIKNFTLTNVSFKHTYKHTKVNTSKYKYICLKIFVRDKSGKTWKTWKQFVGQLWYICFRLLSSICSSSFLIVYLCATYILYWNKARNTNYFSIYAAFLSCRWQHNLVFNDVFWHRLARSVTQWGFDLQKSLNNKDFLLFW